MKAEERNATKTCKIEEDNIRNLNATKTIQQQLKVLWEWSREGQTNLLKQDKNIIKKKEKKCIQKTIVK